MLRPQVARAYRIVTIGFEDGRRSVMVHRLVMEAFVGPRPPGLQVCHGDGNGSNNVLSNLRYDTAKANIHDILRVRGIALGESAYQAKLTDAQVIAIRARHRKGSGSDGCNALAREYGVTPSAMHDMLTGKTWRFIGAEGPALEPRSQ